MALAEAHSRPAAHILPVIVLSQFGCTSLWFAGNAVMSDLVVNFGLPAQALQNLTSAVQLGFISGTLFFALLMLADRFSPSRLFLVSALCGALFNAGIVLGEPGMGSLLLLRFLTGFALAGIYPVGMKIAADHYDRGLGRSLGYLVGALVLGTALPHLLRGLDTGLPWRGVLLATSGLALGGGLLMALTVPDGPHRRQGARLNISVLWSMFRNRAFRGAAFGYFGHMWELYAFWAFVPVLLQAHMALHPGAALNVPMWSFAIIAAGGPACVLSGYLSLRLGAARVAFGALSLSGICCLLSPLLITQSSTPLLLIFLLIWGMCVVADSPLFSTLVAQNADPQIKGTALTLVNCIGFSITIGSIQLLGALVGKMSPEMIFLLLAPGPALGLWALSRPAS